MATDKSKIEVQLSLDAKAFASSLATASGKVKGFSSSLKTSLAGAGREAMAGIETGFKAVGVAAAAAAAGGIYAFVGAMREAVNVSRQVQGLNLAFGAITGSSKLAANELEYVRKVSTDLGLNFMQTADAYKGIFASSQGTILAGEKTRKIFEGIASASTALGLSADQTSGALLAISQMISKGKISAEELRGQLGERLPGAFQLMAQSMGVTTQKLDQMLQKGEVGIENLIKFADLLNEKYKASATGIDTYSKGVNKLTNEYQGLQNEMGGIITNNTFVIEMMKVAASAFSDLSRYVKENRAEMVNLVKVGFMAIVSGAGFVVEAMRFIYNGFQGLSLAAHGFVTIWIKGLGLMVSTIRNLLTPFDLLLQGMVKLGAIDSNPLEDWEKAMEGLGDVSAEEFTTLLTKIEDGNRKFDAASGFVEKFREQIEKIPAEYSDATTKMGKDTEDVSQEVALVGGVWVQVSKEAVAASADTKRAMMADINAIYEKIKDAPKIDYGGGSSADGYATGGDPFHGGLAGYGGGDRRMIMVEDGEHVIRKEAVAKMGHGFFQRFNLLNFPNLQKFATGGPVGPSSSGETINVNLSFGSGSPVAVKTDRIGAAELIRQMQRMQRLAS